jgi:hypothetical protein
MTTPRIAASLPVSRFSLFVAFSALALLACGESGAANARRKLREVHVPEVKQMLRDDVSRHLAGVARAAERIAPGFTAALPDETTRERQMRVALRKLHEPPRGVPQLIASPMTFLAALKPDGRVFVRDADPDPMKGLALGPLFPSVTRALSGRRPEFALGEFPRTDTGDPSPSIVFAAPSLARDDGRVVGGAALGIPLWRLEQRISRQLQLDHASEAGIVLWSYVYRGNELIATRGAHPDLDTIAPDGPTRRAGLARSPGGFTLEREQYGRWYGFAVLPLPMFGADVGVVLVRSDPI